MLSSISVTETMDSYAPLLENSGCRSRRFNDSPSLQYSPAASCSAAISTPIPAQAGKPFLNAYFTHLPPSSTQSVRELCRLVKESYNRRLSRSDRASSRSRGIRIAVR
ncbi:hypothetical protein SDJN03_30208, partial [Cucurbita argyrosperma subsp. sororia]